MKNKVVNIAIRDAKGNLGRTEDVLVIGEVMVNNTTHYLTKATYGKTRTTPVSDILHIYEITWKKYLEKEQQRLEDSCN